MKSETSSRIEIRPYRTADAQQTLAVFLAAVTETAAADYSAEQIAAWARPGQRSLADWDRGMHSRTSYVAVVEGEVAGFSDVDAGGYLDMMFVAPRYGRRGVASRLLSAIEARARQTGARQLSADVSITARPFFERNGFIATAEQHPITAGVTMSSFHIAKPLKGSECY